MKKTLLSGIATLMMAVSLFAAAGDANFYFLDIGFGAASAGMGKATVANAGTLEGIYANPASLAGQEEELNVLFSTVPMYMSDMNIFSGGVSYKLPLPFAFHIAAAGYGMSTGEILGGIQDATGTGATQIEAGDFGATLAAAMGLEIGDLLTLDAGVAFKYVSSTLHTSTISAVAGDVGVIASFNFGLSAGLYAKNLGVGFGTLQSDVTLPLSVLVGVGYTANISDTFYIKALADADLHFLDGQYTANIGVEAGFMNMFSVRLGTIVGSAGSSIVNVTGGLGFAYAIPNTDIVPRFDYSFVWLGDAGIRNNVQIGLSYGFGGDEDEEEDTTSPDDNGGWHEDPFMDAPDETKTDDGDATEEKATENTEEKTEEPAIDDGDMGW